MGTLTDGHTHRWARTQMDTLTDEHAHRLMQTRSWHADRTHADKMGTRGVTIDDTIDLSRLLQAE